VIAELASAVADGATAKVSPPKARTIAEIIAEKALRHGGRLLVTFCSVNMGTMTRGLGRIGKIGVRTDQRGNAAPPEQAAFTAQTAVGADPLH
jgi:hypothetical protein